MLTIHQAVLYLHVVVGACALFLFWIPVFTRKGNLDHKRFGRIFAYAMYTVSGSGIVMSGLDLLFPLASHALESTLSAEESVAAIAAAEAEVRTSALFLFSLSVLVLASTRHGWLAMLDKDDRHALRQPAHVALCAGLAAIGATLLVVGVNTGSALLIVFAPLQMASGFGNLRYAFRNTLRPNEWWIQHLGGFIGSGIGAYTAFAVFGGRTLFDRLFGNPYSDIAIILWTAPTVIGVIAIALLSRKYKTRFGGAWIEKRIERRIAVRSQLFSWK